LPSRIIGAAETSGAKNQSTRPAIVSVIASGVPFIGTCSASMPAAARNFSEFMCVALPLPADA
jgi:hypothetical protein